MLSLYMCWVKEAIVVLWSWSYRLARQGTAAKRQLVVVVSSSPLCHTIRLRSDASAVFAIALGNNAAESLSSSHRQSNGGCNNNAT